MSGWRMRSVLSALAKKNWLFSATVDGAKASSWHKADDCIKKNNSKIGWPFTAYDDN